MGTDRTLIHHKKGATLALAFGPATGETDRRNRLASVLGDRAVGIHSVSHCRQVHGSNVHRVDGRSGGVQMVGDGDGLMTTTPGHGVLVWTADCVPVLLIGEGVVAAVHSGWRGCAADIVGTAIEKIEDQTAVAAGGLSAVIGPSVCGGCYSVGPEVSDALRVFGLEESRWRDGDRVDLGRFLTARLEALGVPTDEIETAGGCTVETTELASYRRDGSAAGRQWAMVFLDR